MGKIYFSILLLAAISNAQISGCTDPQSLNYNPQATVNNGSCIYPQSVAPITSSAIFPGTLDETSGLCISEGEIFTHNDDADDKIYRLTSGGELIGQSITGISNVDWEEIAADETYFYLGDFGNNASGSRQDLRIYRILKESLDATPQIDTISFSYEDQSSLAPVAANTSEFDCEAFIVKDGKIYLFTKKWSSRTTSVYELENSPGVQVAALKSTFNVNGLITGATFISGKRLVALCGYSNSLQPFVWLLYDFAGDDFFSGNKRKLSINAPMHQVEGIASADGETFYVSNEKFQFGTVTVLPKLQMLDLSAFTENIEGLLSVTQNSLATLEVYYDPIRKTLSSNQDASLSIRDLAGKLLINKGSGNIDVSAVRSGIYIVSVDGEPSLISKIAIY